MNTKNKFASFLEKHGAALVFAAASLMFLFLRLRFFAKYGLAQDEVLIISQIKTWDPLKIWHYYGFGGQGFFLQHYIFYALTLGGAAASITYLRLICLAESFLGFFLLYRFTKKYFGIFACLGALFLYAVSPYQIIYTLYIRFYALVMTLVIAECFCYFKALESRENLARFLPLTALFALLSYCTHQFSIFLQPVFLTHFVVFCFYRRISDENKKWFVMGAQTIAIATFFALFIPFLTKKTGLVYGVQDAWLPVKLGLASQRLQLFFWNDAMPLRICSLVFIWISLGLAVTARIAKREKALPEIFLALGIVIPFFFLSHFHFSHFFDKRYLAFWFPVWILVWSCWLEFPAYILGNLKVLQDKALLRNVCLGVFVLVFFFSFFRFSSLSKMRWIESGNREAVTFLEERASGKELPLVLISEPDAGSRNKILPQYYFDILNHEGGSYLDLLTVMRKGAAYEKMTKSAVVWTQAAKRLQKPDSFERAQFGSHELIFGGIFTNWHDVAKATMKVIPEASGLYPSEMSSSTGVLDIGTKAASSHLLTGFSKDEFLSPEANYTWCEGTNIAARFMCSTVSNYVVSARCRAITDLRADFYLNDKLIGNAAVGEPFTNLLFRVDNVPNVNGKVMILRIITSGFKVPGQVNKNVYDNRPLSLCFDKLAVCPARQDPEWASAIDIPESKTVFKAREKTELYALCANIGSESWPCRGDQPVRLSLRWLDQEGREIKDERFWLDGNVLGGDTARVKCQSSAPETPGNYVLSFDLVHENVKFFDEALHIPVKVEN